MPGGIVISKTISKFKISENSNPKNFIGSCLRKDPQSKRYIFSNDFHLTLSIAMALKSSKSKTERREFEMVISIHVK